MPFHRKKLFILLGLALAWGALSRILESGSYVAGPTFHGFGWYDLVGLGFVGYIAYYVLTLRCPSCRKHQIIRGQAISQWHLPNEECFYCGTSLRGGTKSDKE
jgi:hypothetical protein